MLLRLEMEYDSDRLTHQVVVVVVQFRTQTKNCFILLKSLVNHRTTSPMLQDEHLMYTHGFHCDPSGQLDDRSQ